MILMTYLNNAPACTVEDPGGGGGPCCDEILAQLDIIELWAKKSASEAEQANQKLCNE